MRAVRRCAGVPPWGYKFVIVASEFHVRPSEVGPLAPSQSHRAPSPVTGCALRRCQRAGHPPTTTPHPSTVLLNPKIAWLIRTRPPPPPPKICPYPWKQ